MKKKTDITPRKAYDLGIPNIQLLRFNSSPTKSYAADKVEVVTKIFLSAPQFTLQECARI